MCLQLYLATDVPLGLGTFGNLSLEEVEPARLHELRQVFSKRSIRYVGVDGSCSCAFRHVLADGVFEYFDGMFDQESAEARGRAESLTAQLVGLVQAHLPTGVELYPTWSGEAPCAAKETVAKSAAHLRPDRFFFVEGVLYRLGC
jgi:hypothetical protein